MALTDVSFSIASKIAPAQPDIIAPGVGRDGRAITAAIAPSFMTDIFRTADNIIALKRERLAAKQKDPTGTRGGVSGFLAGLNPSQDVSVPGLGTQPLGSVSLVMLAAVAVGAILVVKLLK